MAAKWCAKLLAGVLGGLLVAACGQLPRPFQPAADAPVSELVTVGATSDLRVELIDGPPLPMAKLLSKSVASDFNRYELFARVGEKGDDRWVLRGRVERNWVGPDVKLIHWSLKDRHGDKGAEFVHNLRVSQIEWDYGSPTIIQEVGRYASSKIADSIGLRLRENISKLPSPISGLWVEPVVEAPGNGGRDLTLAMERALRLAGVDMASDPISASRFLSGAVSVDRPVNGQQKVVVQWIMQTNEGKELGRATQRNQVPAGTFDGNWRHVAALVAEAAVPGVMNIVARADSPQQIRIGSARRLNLELPGLGSTLPPPGPPPDADLKQEPGRALPPPGTGG